MSTITIRRTFEVGPEGGPYTPTNVTSAKLSNPTGAYGVKRHDTGVVVVPDGTDLTHIGTGVYEYTYTEVPPGGYTYDYCVEFVYGGETYHFSGSVSGASTACEVTTWDQVVDYIKRKLGYPTVQVELTPDQITDAVNDASRLFSRYTFVMRNNVLREQSESVVAQLDTSTTGVYYVCFLFPESERDILRMNIFEILTHMAYPPMKVGEWYMMRMFFEMFQRVRGTEPDWRYDPESRKLYVDVWGGPYDVFYITGHLVTWETLLTGSKRRYATEFLRTCVAYAMLTLARIRGKFGGIPTPGGTLTTDAESLRTEGNTTLTDVEGKLKKIAHGRYQVTIG
jgi:hypothetical protein